MQWALLGTLPAPRRRLVATIPGVPLRRCGPVVARAGALVVGPEGDPEPDRGPKRAPTATGAPPRWAVAAREPSTAYGSTAKFKVPGRRRRGLHPAPTTACGVNAVRGPGLRLRSSLLPKSLHACWWSLSGLTRNHALRLDELRDLRQQALAIESPEARRTSQSRQRQNRLDAAQLEGLAGDYRSGMPVRDIAERYRVSRDTVNDHARRMGLPRRYRKS